MDKFQIRSFIDQGQTSIGIEFGSTRIKAVMVGPDHSPIAQGGHNWENKLERGIWTYSLEDVISGLQDCYLKLNEDVNKKYGTEIKKTGAIGISAMMHGYLAFDSGDKLLVPFRTWRNTITEEAAEKLTKLFDFNIPQRWSIAHLYQAILNGEEHVKNISFVTTLAGYVHWLLSGEKVLGIGDASGMFPINSTKKDYNSEMLDKFTEIIMDKDYPWNIRTVLPKVLCAGSEAGRLTASGAKLLDPNGGLQAGIPLAPPEGDAGTGMTATNSVAVRTGNISAGTSVFSMAVLEKPLKKLHTEIDMVTTPSGEPVAMVHCNNCTSDINAYAELFCEFSKLMGKEYTMPQVLDSIFYNAMKGDTDCGGIISYNYYSGEPVTGLNEGRPMLTRKPDASFSFANFSRNLLYSAAAALKIGMDILTKEENAKIDTLYGHGGFFKAKAVGQQVMADALGVPVSVMETAGEGGPWGMAILASYLVNKEENEDLGNFLQTKVFSAENGETLIPDTHGAEGFTKYLESYKACLGAEKELTEKFS